MPRCANSDEMRASVLLATFQYIGKPETHASTGKVATSSVAAELASGKICIKIHAL